MSSRLPVLISTAHSAPYIPFDVLAAMLGDDAWDPDVRQRRIRELFDQNDPGTDALFQLDGAAGIHTPVSRFVVDLNRRRDDHSANGVVKQTDFAHTPLYAGSAEPTPAEVEARLQRYWDPFHAALANHLERERPLLLLDGHSMSPVGPALGPDPGAQRPAFNLITGGGLDGEPDPAVGNGSVSIPGWLARRLVDALWDAFRDLLGGDRGVPAEITINAPFAVGAVQAHHGGRAGVPVVSLEFHRALYLQPDLDDPAGLDVAIPGRITELNARLRDAVKSILPDAQALRDAGGWHHVAAKDPAATPGD